MKQHQNWKFLLLLCALLPVLTISAQAPEAYVISMWTFDRSQRFEENEELLAEHNQPVEQGILKMRGGDIDSGGSGGVSHTDFTCGQFYPATAAIQWDEILGGDDIRTDEDAQVELAVSTVDWEEISLFFYYRAENTDSFDVSYHLGDGDWKLIADDVQIDPTDEWSNIGVGFQDVEDLRNRSLVVFLIHDFSREFSQGEFRMDNIAVMGTRISKPNDCPPQIEMLTPLENIGIVLNSDSIPVYTGESGFDFQVSDDETPIEDLTILAITTDPNVINQLALTTVDATNGIYRLEVGAPHGYPGIANVILRVSDQSGNSTERSLQYGATNLPISSINNFHQGTANASAGVALDTDTMLIANDANQRLGIYRRDESGLPLAVFDVTDNLDLNTTNDGTINPVMIESASSIGNRQFWLGSHSNSDRGRATDNPYRLFATEITGSGTDAQLAFIGFYDNLFDDIHQWGRNYGYNFRRVINREIRPTDADGFKIEGFTIAPDGQTAFIGMRTPLIPPDNRQNALLIPIENFPAWFNNGNPGGPPALGEPIIFNLGGLGIRALECNGNGCVIVAGDIVESDRFALYTWSGNRQDAPILRNVNLDGLHPESVILNPDDSLASGSTIQLVSDSNEIDWYRAGRSGDELEPNLQLFRSNIITLD